MKSNKAIVTGGAGFVGSHLTERLLEEHCKVTVVDDFSTGKPENIAHLLKHPGLAVVKEDLRSPRRLKHVVEEHDLIFHLAANPEVRVGETEPKVHFEENILATFNVLEAVRQAENTKTIVFTSTSTVYGEALEIPTPEDYGPSIPISTYGASKLASEALISSYANTFGHRALILRLANVIGPRSNHGVIADFVKKITANPKQLEILGDGTQEKSYIYIADFIEATIHVANAFLRSTKRIDIYNVGSRDRITVKEIAKIVAKEMHSPKIKFKCTGGVDGGRGWRGDVKTMQLSIQKLLATGWKPKYTSKQAVKVAAKNLARTQTEPSNQKSQLRRHRANTDPN